MNWTQQLKRLAAPWGDPRPTNTPLPAAAGGAGELLCPTTLSRIGTFELISQSVVDGVMSGKHRSTHKGGCCEFSEHRPYSQGDEIRLIDWRLFARRDRHYVKLFDDETNLHAWLVIDSSGSMAFGESTLSKFDYARTACACLGRLLLRQRDCIGLLTERWGEWHHLPPRPRAAHFQGICNLLRESTPAGNRTLNDLLVHLQKLVKRRGMVILFSDCFGDVDALVQSLRLLRARGHEVMVFQVLAPEEITFSFRESAVFSDLESVAPRMQVSPGRIRKRYLERFEAFQQQLRSAVIGAGCDLHTLSTEDELGDTLTHYLSYRAARRKVAGRA